MGAFAGEGFRMAASNRSITRLAAMLIVVSSFSCSREPATPRGQASDPSIAVVEAVEGDASVVHGSQKTAAAPGLRLTAGDRLETGTPGKMRARLTDDSVLAIGANTTLALAELALDDAARRGRIDVALGRFWMNVTKWTGTGESRYEISTPTAVAGVRGTTLWGDTDVDAICALEGTIEVRSRRSPDLPPASLSAGNCASKLREGELAPLAPSPEQLQKFLDEILIRTK
jgi:hypothetical protein